MTQVYTQTEGVKRDNFIFKIVRVSNNLFCLLYRLEVLQFENSTFRDRPFLNTKVLTSVSGLDELLLDDASSKHFCPSCL
jgi:hypothetical protein